MTTQKWGGLALFVLAAAFIIAPLIYLMGNWRDALGLLGYHVADLLYGPLFAASLITAFFVIREQIGERAPRRMSLALIAASLAAFAMVAAAIARSTNRDYFIRYERDMSQTEYNAILRTLLMIVPGILATGQHFLGWSMILLGSAAWSSGAFPRALSVLTLIIGASSLIAYLIPDDGAMFIGLPQTIWAIWQGVVLWRAGPPMPTSPLPAPNEGQASA